MPAQSPPARQRTVRLLTLAPFFVTLSGVFFIPQGVLTANPLGLLKGHLRKEALTRTNGKRQPATRPATFNQRIDGTEPAVPAARSSRAVSTGAK